MGDMVVFLREYGEVRVIRICSAKFVCVASNPPSHEIHEKKTKTRKRKIRLGGIDVVPSPVPHTKPTKISEMH